jgi:hypothetical protein
MMENKARLSILLRIWNNCGVRPNDSRFTRAATDRSGKLFHRFQLPKNARSRSTRSGVNCSALLARWRSRLISFRLGKANNLQNR